MAIMKFVTQNKAGSPYTKKYHDLDAYEDLTHYIFNPEKTKQYIGGMGVYPEYAAEHMRLVTKLYNQEKGVLLRHWVLSFHFNELAALEQRTGLPCQDVLYALGQRMIAYYGFQYQIVFAVHWNDIAHAHLHFVMNTTNYMTGKKYHCDRKEYYSYKKYVKKILAPYGLSAVVEKDYVANDD